MFPGINKEPVHSLFPRFQELMFPEQNPCGPSFLTQDRVECTTIVSLPLLCGVWGGKQLFPMNLFRNLYVNSLIHN